MKKYFTLIMIIAMLAVSSCKKELEINVEKTYVENGVTSGTLGFGGIILTLMPDGKADFMFGGDIMSRGTYTIKGNTIILTINNSTSKIKVISETKLLCDDDKILILRQ